MQRLARLQQRGWVIVIGLWHLAGKEPVWDGGQGCRTRDQDLLALPGLCQGDDMGKSGNALILEKLSGRKLETCPTSTRHHLDTQNRVTTQRKEVIMHSYPLHMQQM